MHHHIDAVRGENAVQRRRVRQAGFVEPNPGGNSRAVPVDEIVKDDGFVARRQQLANAMTADVAGSAGNEYFHGPDLYCFSIYHG